MKKAILVFSITLIFLIGGCSTVPKNSHSPKKNGKNTQKKKNNSQESKIKKEKKLREKVLLFLSQLVLKKAKKETSNELYKMAKKNPIVVNMLLENYKKTFSFQTKIAYLSIFEKLLNGRPKIVKAIFSSLEEDNFHVHDSAEKILLQNLPAVFPELLRFLDQKDSSIRYQSVDIIGKGKKNLLQVDKILAKKLLLEKEEFLQKKILWTLGELRSFSSISAIIKILRKSQSKKIRLVALQTLEKMKDLTLNGVNSLRTMFQNDPSLYLRLYSAYVILKFRKAAPLALTFLRESLTWKDDKLLIASLQAVGKLRINQPFLEVRACLKNSNKEVREEAVFSIGQMSFDSTTSTLKAISDLLPALQDEYESIRKKATIGISNFGEIGIKKLIQYYSRLSLEEKQNLIQALTFKKIKSPRLIRAWIEKLGGDQRVVLDLRLALKNMGSLVVPVLIEHLKNSNSIYRKNIILILATIKKSISQTKTVVALFVKFLQDSSKDVRLESKNALISMGVLTKDFLCAQYGKKKEDVRITFLEILRNINPPSPDIITVFLQALGDSSSRVTSEAIFGLQTMGQSLVPTFIKILKEEKNGRIRKGLVRILGKLGKKALSARSILQKIANTDSDLPVRYEAKWALSKLK